MQKCQDYTLHFTRATSAHEFEIRKSVSEKVCKTSGNY